MSSLLSGRSPVASASGVGGVGGGGGAHTPVTAGRKRELAAEGGAPGSLITSAKKRARTDASTPVRPLRMTGLEEDEAVAVTPAPPPRAQDVGAAGLPTVEKKRRSRLSSLFSPVFSALGLVAADAGEKRAVEMATPAALLSPGGGGGAAKAAAEPSPGAASEATPAEATAGGAEAVEAETEAGEDDVQAGPDELLDDDEDDELAAGGEGEDEVDDDYDEGEFDPFYFIQQLPPVESIQLPHAPLEPAPRTRRSKKMCLVLDLDETLVHSTMESPGNEDFTFPVFFNGQQHQVYVRKRPHVHEFLKRVSQMFEVIVFTASAKVYAEQLLDVLDPEGELIRHRMYRESCVYVAGNYLKDLRVLGRDLRQVAIVDNSPQAFGFQLDNGIPIESWFDDESDRALLELLPFLEKLQSARDARPLIRKRFRLQNLVDRASGHGRYYQ